MRTVSAEKGKSPYVRQGKVPYQYHFKRCSHRRADGRPSAELQQTANWTGDVCTICGVILKNLTRHG